MTSTTTEPLGWAAPLESPLSQTPEELAADIASGLYRLADTIRKNPETAPLWEAVLDSLIIPVSATRDPGAALAALCRSTTGNGGFATQAEPWGVDLVFSKAVRAWAMTRASQDPEPVVVGTAPVAHDDVPDDEPNTEVQDDADDTPTLSPTGQTEAVSA